MKENTSNPKKNAYFDLIVLSQQTDTTPSKDRKRIQKLLLRIGAKVLWLQFGIQNTEAEKISNSAGITCIMNKCIKQEYQRLFLKMKPVFPVLLPE